MLPFYYEKLVEEFKKQISCLGENTEEYVTFTVPIEKLQQLIKMEKKLQKICFTFYSLLIALDLSKALYQILLIIYLKDFIELNVHQNVMIKNVKHMKINISTTTVRIEYKKFKHDLTECKCLNFRKIYQQNLDEKL